MHFRFFLAAVFRNNGPWGGPLPSIWLTELDFVQSPIFLDSISREAIVFDRNREAIPF